MAQFAVTSTPETQASGSAFFAEASRLRHAFVAKRKMPPPPPPPPCLAPSPAGARVPLAFSMTRSVERAPAPYDAHDRYGHPVFICCLCGVVGWTPPVNSHFSVGPRPPNKANQPPGNQHRIGAPANLRLCLALQRIPKSGTRWQQGCRAPFQKCQHIPCVCVHVCVFE